MGQVTFHAPRERKPIDGVDRHKLHTNKCLSSTIAAVQRLIATPRPRHILLLRLCASATRSYLARRQLTSNARIHISTDSTRNSPRYDSSFARPPSADSYQRRSAGTST